MQKEVSIALGVVSFVLMVTFAYLFHNKLKTFKKYGYLGVFMISLIGNIAIFSPSAPLISMLAGSLYNPWVVGFIAALGAVIGETLSYLIGNAAGQTSFTELPYYETIQRFMERNGFLTLFAFAAIPNPFFDAVGLLAGATGFPFWLFVVASFLGKICKFTFFAFVGTKFLK